MGGDHLGTRQVGLADDLFQVEWAHERDKQEQAAEHGAEGAWAQVQFAHVGYGRRNGFEGGGTLVIATTGQAGEALLAHEYGQGIGTNAVACERQLALDVVDGQVLLAQGNGQLADTVASRGMLGAGLGLLEKGGTFVGVMAELVAEDAQGIVGVAEAASDLWAGQLLDEKGTQGLVLALGRGLGAEEEPGLVGIS